MLWTRRSLPTRTASASDQNLAADPDALGRGCGVHAPDFGARPLLMKSVPPERRSRQSSLDGDLPSPPSSSPFEPHLEPHRVAAERARSQSSRGSSAQGEAGEDAGVRADGLPALPPQAQGPEEAWTWT